MHRAIIQYVHRPLEEKTCMRLAKLNTSAFWAKYVNDK